MQEPKQNFFLAEVRALSIIIMGTMYYHSMLCEGRKIFSPQNLPFLVMSYPTHFCSLVCHNAYIELTLKTTSFTDYIRASLAKIHSTLVQLLAAILTRSIAKLCRQPTRYLFHLLSELRFLLCEDMVAKILSHGKKLLNATLGDCQSRADNNHFIECGKLAGDLTNPITLEFH